MLDQDFARHVWDTLSTIDIGDMVEQKGNLDYLSWSNAWTDILRIFPQSTYTAPSITEYENTTVMVWTSCTIREGDNSLMRPCWLPVMDNWNKSIPDPTSRDLSDSMMRCLVKNLAMFGYGLSLWRKSELVDSSDFTKRITEEQADILMELVDATGTNLDTFLTSAGAHAVLDIRASHFASLLDILKKKAAA